MKPLLASAVTKFDKLQFPVIASPKLDGIRCLVTENGIVGRSLKPLPNRFLCDALRGLPIGLDGEIITYTAGQMDELNTVQSKVMSREGVFKFIYHVFDNFSQPNSQYEYRRPPQHWFGDNPYAKEVLTKYLYNHEDLEAYEEEHLALGYEGVMLRRPEGPYKFGRSTEREAILLKVKRFFDAEAIIIGKVEQMENTNEAKTNLLGRTERSSAKDGLVGKSTLGALECEWEGVQFSIGTGMDDATRRQLWENDSLLGQLVTFKYQRKGPNGKPLLPVFKGLRHAVDVS